MHVPDKELAGKVYSMKEKAVIAVAVKIQFSVLNMKKQTSMKIDQCIGWVLMCPLFNVFSFMVHI